MNSERQNRTLQHLLVAAAAGEADAAEWQQLSSDAAAIGGRKRLRRSACWIRCRHWSGARKSRSPTSARIWPIRWRRARTAFR